MNEKHRSRLIPKFYWGKNNRGKATQDMELHCLICNKMYTLKQLHETHKTSGDIFGNNYDEYKCENFQCQVLYVLRGNT